MSKAGEESVLARWSRRKLEAEQASEQASAMAESESAAESLPPSSPDDEQDAAPPLTDADMPDIESLNEDSDFSPFMSPGVSEELRNLAMRKLFRAPVFNIRDGLDEYDDDFTEFAKLGDIVTSDMKHRIEMEQQKLREQLAEQGETSADNASLDAQAMDEDEFDEFGEAEPIDDEAVANGAPGEIDHG